MVEHITHTLYFVSLVTLYLYISARVLFQPSQVAATSEPISFGRQVYRPNGIPPHELPYPPSNTHTLSTLRYNTTADARTVYLESEIEDCFQ